MKKLPAPLKAEQLEEVNFKLLGSGYTCSPSGEFITPKGNNTGVTLGWLNGNYLAYRAGKTNKESEKLWTGDPREFTRRYWYSM